MPTAHYTVQVSNDQERLAEDFEAEDLIDPTSEPLKSSIEKVLNKFNTHVEKVKIKLTMEV